MNAARFARLSLALCAALALASPARAATLTVTSAADDGSAGTLRSVLASASAGDTITFALAPRTKITLTQGMLTIDKTLHVVGPTGGGVVIDAHRATRIFAISGGTASQPVTLANLHLRNGNAPESSGGGLGNAGVTTVTNCTLANNSAEEAGGIYNIGTLTLTNCILSDNHATRQDSNGGGGLLNQSGMVTLTNCTLSDNTTTASGGGLKSIGGKVFLNRCTIRQNYGQFGGGGVLVQNTGQDKCRLAVTNSTFTGNSDSVNGAGGGGVSINRSIAKLTNCTFTANSAPGNGGGGGLTSISSTTTLTNDIFYGDTAGFDNEIYSGTAAVTYCDVQGGYAGTGNKDADPQFVSASVPYDLRLSASSPCIDAGTPNGAPPVDRDGNPRDAMPDIGAFEYQP